MSASVTETFTINSSAATGVVGNALVNFSTISGPIPAGTALFSYLVSPSTWTGTFSLSGPDAALFVINSSNQLAVGAAPLPAGSYSVTVTANP